MVKTTDIYLGTTRDGYNVYDRADSHIHSEHGINTQLIKIALSKIYANGCNFKKKKVCFNTSIGFNNCVKTTPTDDVIMVYRKGRLGQTPMVKGRNPEPSSILNVIIRKDKAYENHYTLISCYVGKSATREPWDKEIQTDEERELCKKFWSTHALIYNADLIDWERTPSSKTDNC